MTRAVATERTWSWGRPAVAGTAVASALLPNPALGAAIVGLVALLPVALSRPILAVAAYAAVIMANAAQVAADFHGLPAIGSMMVPALILVLLARAALGLEELGIMLRVLPFAFTYLALRATALLWVAEPEPTADALIELTKNILIALTFAGFLTSFARLRAIARTVGLTVSVVAALSVFQYLTQTFDNTYLGFSVAVVQGIAGETMSWRLTGPVGDPNYYGQLLVIALPIAAVLGLTERGLLRFGGIIGTGAILLAIVFTFSRGALIGVAVMLMLASLTLHRRWSMIVIGGVFVAVAVSVTTEGFVQRVSAIVQAVQAVLEGSQFIADPALAQRLSVMGAAVTMISQSPLLGIGAGQFPVRYHEYALASGFDVGAPPEAHSLFLELAAEGGLLTLTVFLALIGVAAIGAIGAVKRLQRARRGDDAALVFALTLGFAGYLSTAMFLHGQYARYFWLMLSMIVAAAATVPGAILDRPRITSLGSAPVPMQYSTLPGIIAIMWRSKWLILIVALLSAGAASLRNFTTPREYQAELDLLYRFGRDYFPITPGEARRNWGENVIVSLDAALITEMRLLGTEEQFERTVEMVGEETILSERRSEPIAGRVQSLGWRVFTEADPGGAQTAPAKADLARNLGDRFDIRRVSGSAVVTVSARHMVPEIADSLVKQHVAGYLDRREALLDPDAASFFDDRIAAAEQAYATLIEIRQKALDESQGGGDAVQDMAATNGMAGHLAALDAMIGASVDNLAELQRERQNWDLSRKFRREVMPTVEIIDRRSAAGKPVGLAPIARVAIAGAIAFVFASAFALLATMLRKTPLEPSA